MLIPHGASSPEHYRSVANTMAFESLEWGIILFIGELFARMLHDRFFSNTRWITRGGEEIY